MNSLQRMAAWSAAGFVLVLGLFIVFFETNDAQDWQVLQGLDGSVTIIDTPGPYYSGMGKTRTWPRAIEAQFDNCLVGFNDNSIATLPVFVRFETPANDEQRKLLHAQYSSPEALKVAVGRWVAKCVGSSGSMMSASEHRAARKGEFSGIVRGQVEKGLYKQRVVNVPQDEVQIAEVDEHGNKVAQGDKTMVKATEIVRDRDGAEIITETSPLARYGITIIQLDPGEPQYDPKTLEQFDKRKDSYLQAEQFKAERKTAIENRLKVIDEGKANLARIEAEENLKNMVATKEAQKKADVAELAKKEAVMKASQKVEVAEQDRLEAEKLRQIAEVKAKTAELDKQAAISAAEAKQKTIELGGGISDEKRVLAEIESRTRIGEAEAWSKRPMPTNVMIGGTGGGTVLNDLISMSLMKHNGMLDAK